MTAADKAAPDAASTIIEHAGRRYRVDLSGHATRGVCAAIWSQVTESTGWRITPQHERRLKPGSPLYRDVLDAARRQAETGTESR